MIRLINKMLRHFGLRIGILEPHVYDCPVCTFHIDGSDRMVVEYVADGHRKSHV